MEELITILMNRDGLTRKEAIAVLKNASELIEAAIEDGDYDAAEDVMLNILGVETDYIIDLF